MRGLLLDTSILVAAERGEADLDELIEDDEGDLGIAAITLAELLLGVELGRGRERARRRAFVDDVRGAFSVVAYDERTAEHHAALLAHTRRAGLPRGGHDAIIAATARATGRVIVTRDRRGFEGLPGVRLR
jgi:tRNA(fMet)-specific endonuclease VapC